MQRSKQLIVLTLATLLTLSFSSQVNAASNGLGINPRRNYTVKPGETKKDTLVVTNLNKTDDLNVSIQVIDFRATNETGIPALLLTQKNPTRWSLKPFLRLPATYTIKGGQSADIPFTITIPANLGGGSYYSAIRYSAGGNADKANLNLSSASSTLMFVTVPGTAKESLTLKSFGAFVPNADFVNGSYKTYFGASQPKYMSYTLKNEGNVVEQPKGSVQIKNIFGKQVLLLENINPNRELVILDQTRRIDACIKAPDNARLTNTDDSFEDISKCKNPSLLPGRYTANLGLLYGGMANGSSEIKATTSFWYLPAWSIIAFVVVLAALIFAIWYLVKKIKNHGKPTYGSRRR